MILFTKETNELSKHYCYGGNIKETNYLLLKNESVF